MSDWLSLFDRLRAEDPRKAEELLSRIGEGEWGMTFEGLSVAEQTDGFGLQCRGWRASPPEIRPPRNRDVRRFIRNPEAQLQADYTRGPKFGWDLLAYCSEYVAAVPAQAQRLTKTALILFSRNERDGLPEAACLTVGARGLLAFGDYQLGNLERAEATLSELLESLRKRGCAGCEAGTLRKASFIDRERAYLGLDLHGYPRAYDKCTAAIDLYSDPLTPDHDVFGNGLARSHMTRGVVLSFWGRPGEALSDLAIALRMCSTRSPLFVRCIGNTAIVLLKSGSDKNLVRAAELVVDLKKRLSLRRKACTERAMTFWLEGQISGRLGATEDAIDCHEEALTDFVELKARVNASAVVADLSKLTLNSPERIRDHIRRLDPERTRRLPSWIPDFLQRRLAELYRLACSRSVDEAALLKAIMDLRESSGCRFPCLI